METIESVKWLKQQNLYDKAVAISPSLKKVLMDCLGITEERILILGDKGAKQNKISPVLSAAYYFAAQELNLQAKLVLQPVKTRGTHAEDDVVTSLGDLREGNVVIVNMSDKMGSLGEVGKSFRKFCTKLNHKFISAMSLGDLHLNKLDDVMNAINVSYQSLKMQQERVKEILDDASEIRVTTEAGTDLHFNVHGQKAVSSDGHYKEPGQGGNLPAGEVFIPCNGKKVEGTVVIDGSSRNHRHTTVIKEPIRLSIEEGSVIQVEGGKEAEELRKALDWAASKAKHPGTVRRAAELGIGFNPQAKIIGATVIDEKTLGTAHLGIGSNYWFGGSIFAITHYDQVFKNPKFTIDGKPLEF